MNKICIAVFLTLMATTCFAQTPTPSPTPSPTPDIELIVCQSCEDKEYDNINEALEDAVDGDTIKIVWESSLISVYPESFEIDKKITLTSDGTGDNLPLIEADVNDSGTEGVIYVSSDGVTISNLRIRNSDPYYCCVTPVPASDNSDETSMGTEAGILIKAGCCTISNCIITRCRVGILLAPDDNQDVCGNLITDCIIGEIWDGPDPYWTFPDDPDRSEGNFFGIVHIAPNRDDTDVDMTTNYSFAPDEIINCTIQGNRFYGVVLRNGSQAYVTNNKIIWNGTAEALTSTHHFGKGGILSLFTSSELETTSGSDEVEIQSPKIFSNTIFGNSGYQVCVVSENDNYRDISNIPVIMNNNIGPNPFAEGSPVPAGGYPHLVSCASESSDSVTNLQYGSAPILAFNNIYRDAPDKERENYYQHPLQTDGIQYTPVNSPAPADTPTPTPAIPTGTPFPPTPTTLATYTAVPAHSPTPASKWTPFIFQTPNPTPPTLPYQMHLRTWTINDMYRPHGFVGGDEPSEFDFHLIDNALALTPNPTVTATPRSGCFNAGPFDLEPGQTQENEVPDTGWVDLGRHIKPDVPVVADIIVNDDISPVIVTWDLPTHYSDGTLFDDAQGIIRCWGNYFGKFGPIFPLFPTEYHSLCSVIWIDPATVPATADRIGIAVFNNRGEKSDIVWEVFP